MKYLMSISILVCLIAGSQAKISASDRYNIAPDWGEAMNLIQRQIQSSKKDEVKNILKGVNLVKATADASSEDYLNRLWDEAQHWTSSNSVLIPDSKLFDFMVFSFKAMGVGGPYANAIASDYHEKFWPLFDYNQDDKLEKDEFRLLVATTAIVGTQAILLVIDDNGDGLIEPKGFNDLLKTLITGNDDVMIGLNEENLRELGSKLSKNGNTTKNQLRQIDITMFLLSNWLSAFDPSSYTPIPSHMAMRRTNKQSRT